VCYKLDRDEFDLEYGIKKKKLAWGRNLLDEISLEGGEGMTAKREAIREAGVEQAKIISSPGNDEEPSEMT
jgi:hypothetical protein